MFGPMLNCQSRIYSSLLQKSDLVQNVMFLTKRNYAINNCMAAKFKSQQHKNINNICVNSQRQVSFRGRSIIRFSPISSAFIFGFGAMGGLIFLDNLYDKYRRSGSGITDIFNWMRSAPNPEVKADDADELSSKYARILSEVPNIKPSRIVPGSLNLPNLKITLLQYQTCPFCCKVRAFLDYYGLPYEVVEVNPVFRGQLKFSESYRKVPILLISSTTPAGDNNQQQLVLNANLDNNNILQLNDSTLIISTLTSFLLSKRPKSRHYNESMATISKWYLNSQVYLHQDEEKLDESTKVFTAKSTKDELVNKYFLMIGDIDPAKFERIDGVLAEERRWRKWVDDDLVHVLSPNIYRTFDESLRSFNYFSIVGEWEQNFSNWERKTVINVGAMAMYLVGKKLKKKYRLKDDVRQSLYDSCNYWLKNIGPDRRFMGGELPNLADLAVYGVLNSIEGCDAFNDLRNNTKISEWYFDVQTMVKQGRGSQNIKEYIVA